MTFRCNRCDETACAEVACEVMRTVGVLKGRPCGMKYRRCAAHGGEAGARRSLKSHMGLYHPKASGGQ